jgi:CheY-like chemotaxis protein
VQSLTEVLRVNAESTVEFHPPGAESSFVLSARVAYLGDSYWGLRFPDGMDPSLLGRYRMWVQEARRGQAQLDLNRFDPGGVEARPGGVSRGEPAGPKVRLHVDRDPLILVLAEGEAFPAHLASAVGRKFGVAALDLIRGLVHPCLVGLGADGGGDWGRVRLILIHQLVRSGSALELCRRLVHEEQCPLPILLAGTEEEFDLKRNRALSAGAVDYLVVEPFRVLSLLRSLGETLQLFT